MENNYENLSDEQRNELQNDNVLGMDSFAIEPIVS